MNISYRQVICLCYTVSLQILIARDLQVLLFPEGLIEEKKIEQYYKILL